MSAPFRDFDAEIQEFEGDPITFKLGGTVFECLNPLPLGLILVMTKDALDEANVEAQASQAGILWKFVIPEQHKELDRVIGELTDVTVITKIIEYVMSESTGRPTRGS